MTLLCRLRRFCGRNWHMCRMGNFWNATLTYRIYSTCVGCNILCQMWHVWCQNIKSLLFYLLMSVFHLIGSRFVRDYHTSRVGWARQLLRLLPWLLKSVVPKLSFSFPWEEVKGFKQTVRRILLKCSIRCLISLIDLIFVLSDVIVIT